MRYLTRALGPLICTTIFLAGCAPDPTDKENLTAGYSALDSKQYNDAITRADSQLGKSQDGEVSAEALYLKGRAFEQRAKPDQRGANSDLDSAASYYQQALTLAPAKPLEGYIHASLGNVDYWRDDFYGALQQFSDAYDLVDSTDLKSFMLYRAGLCQQRLGQFGVADKSFQAVQQRFAGTDAAARAKDHEGFHDFNVRVATFSSVQAAESAAAALSSMSVSAHIRTLPTGQSIVLVGPEGSYTEALGMKVRVAAQYPDAMIVP